MLEARRSNFYLNPRWTLGARNFSLAFRPLRTPAIPSPVPYTSGFPSPCPCLELEPQLEKTSLFPVLTLLFPVSRTPSAPVVLLGSRSPLPIHWKHLIVKERSLSLGSWKEFPALCPPVRVCGPLPKSLPYLGPKCANSPAYRIYDLTNKSIPSCL